MFMPAGLTTVRRSNNMVVVVICVSKSGAKVLLFFDICKRKSNFVEFGMIFAVYKGYGSAFLGGCNSFFYPVRL